MLIKRRIQEEEVPETDEKKQDKNYKQLRNLGIASLGTGAALGAGHVIGKAMKKVNKDSKITEKDLRNTGIGGIALGTIGAGLTTYAGIKRHNLRKKLKEEGEKKNDNIKKE